MSEEELSVEEGNFYQEEIVGILSVCSIHNRERYRDDVARCRRKGEVSSLAFAVSRALWKYLLANSVYPCTLPVNTSGVNKGQNEPDNRSNGIEKS